MKKGILVGLVVVIVIAVLVFVVGHKKTNEEAPVTTTPTNTTDTSTTPAASDAVSSDEVEIEDFVYKEKTITVKRGTKVTWTNKDSVAHTVTFDDASLSSASSGMLEKDGTFSHTFDTTGTFAYHCTPHPQMTGTVIVTE